MILATTSAIRPEKERRLLDRGVTVIKQDAADEFVDLKMLMAELYSRQIDSILLEGGGGLNAAALKAGIVDKVMIFIAPKIIGGKDALTPVEGEGISMIKDAIALEGIRVSRFGEDVLIEGYVKGESCLPVL